MLIEKTCSLKSTQAAGSRAQIVLDALARLKTFFEKIEVNLL
ncbi:hypothetical protein AACH10_20355 [Ideonella sp. DXS22W]|uniref:Uncharacterized protein n=1 Tax=Pseudaquabacterium inlustre TaxID=2984192 RepID=A0ABU9CLA5_9BURK